MNIRIHVAAVLVVLFATACSKTDATMAADAAPLSVTPSITVDASASAAAADAVTAESDPLPNHFEAAGKVRAEIGKSNYRAELDRIEKEIE